jgi:hypothetical protein
MEPDVRAHKGVAALRAAQRATEGLVLADYWEISKLLGECPEVLEDGGMVRPPGGCPDVVVENDVLW